MISLCRNHVSCKKTDGKRKRTHAKKTHLSESRSTHEWIQCAFVLINKINVETRTRCFATSFFSVALSGCAYFAMNGTIKRRFFKCPSFPLFHSVHGNSPEFFFYVRHSTFSLSFFFYDFSRGFKKKHRRKKTKLKMRKTKFIWWNFVYAKPKHLNAIHIESANNNKRRRSRKEANNDVENRLRN